MSLHPHLRAALLLITLSSSWACSTTQRTQDDALTTPPTVKQDATDANDEHDPALKTAQGLSAKDLRSFEDEPSGLYGFRHGESGPVVLPPKYNFAYEFEISSGLAGVVLDNQWWYINVRGEPVYKAFIYDNGPDYPAEGMVRFVGEQGMVGFLDERGQVIYSPQFDWASPFEEGKARFCKGCKAIADGDFWRYEGGQWGTLSRDGAITYDEQ